MATDARSNACWPGAPSGKRSGLGSSGLAKIGGGGRDCNGRKESLAMDLEGASVPDSVEMLRAEKIWRQSMTSFQATTGASI